MYGGICPECGQWAEFGQEEVNEDDKIVCPECGKESEITIIE